MTDSLGRIFDMWIVPLACRIKELESTPSDEDCPDVPHPHHNAPVIATFVRQKEETQLRSLQECKDQVAKKHYYDTWDKLCPNGNLDGVPDEWVNEAAELYTSQFKKGDQTEQRWISVDEEKPPYYQNVLVYGGHTKTRINVAWRATDDNGQDCYTRLNSQGLFVNITHWMPLPSPPKV